jgi:hypothetical protein
MAVLERIRKWRADRRLNFDEGGMGGPFSKHSPLGSSFYWVTFLLQNRDERGHASLFSMK